MSSSATESVPGSVAESISETSRLRQSIVHAFAHPTGLMGRLAGRVMSMRPSNRQRNLWGVELLDPLPGHRVLEVGSGPGVALEAMLSCVGPTGLVVGVDHSEVMQSQAAARNAAAFAEGRLALVQSSVEALPLGGAPFTGRFDRLYACNTVMFWPEPARHLERLRTVMRPGGRVVVVHQPRGRGADAEAAVAAGDALRDLLIDAGFGAVRIERLDSAGTPVVGVVAEVPLGEGPSGETSGWGALSVGAMVF